MQPIEQYLMPFVVVFLIGYLSAKIPSLTW